MELTRKQIILIAAVSGAILLLTVAAVLIFTPGEEALAAPTASPTATAVPTPTPSPTATPAPTEYRLPLVPQWEAPQPGSDPANAGVFAPQTVIPEGTAGPWLDAGDGYDEDDQSAGLRAREY